MKHPILCTSAAQSIALSKAANPNTNLTHTEPASLFSNQCNLSISQLSKAIIAQLNSVQPLIILRPCVAFQTLKSNIWTKTHRLSGNWAVMTESQALTEQEFNPPTQNQLNILVVSIW